jgi:hypothetical protein
MENPLTKAEAAQFVPPADRRPRDEAYILETQKYLQIVMLLGSRVQFILEDNANRFGLRKVLV